MVVLLRMSEATVPGLHAMIFVAEENRPVSELGSVVRPSDQFHVLASYSASALRADVIHRNNLNLK